MDLAEILRDGGDGQFVQEREEGVRQREVAPFAGEAESEEMDPSAADIPRQEERLPLQRVQQDGRVMQRLQAVMFADREEIEVMVGPVAEDVAERRIGGDGADAENGVAAGRSGDAVGLRQRHFSLLERPQGGARGAAARRENDAAFFRIAMQGGGGRVVEQLGGRQQDNHLVISEIRVDQRIDMAFRQLVFAQAFLRSGGEGLLREEQLLLRFGGIRRHEQDGDGRLAGRPEKSRIILRISVFRQDGAALSGRHRVFDDERAAGDGFRADLHVLRLDFLSGHGERQCPFLRFQGEILDADDDLQAVPSQCPALDVRNGGVVRTGLFGSVEKDDFDIWRDKRHAVVPIAKLEVGDDDKAAFSGRSQHGDGVFQRFVRHAACGGRRPSVRQFFDWMAV